MTRAAIVKEIKERFSSIKEKELKEFADGLETIQQIISERPYLKTSVDFEAIRETLYEDFKLFIAGEKECYLHNKIMKVPRRLVTLGTIHGTIPMFIRELSEGTVRPEFRHANPKGKSLPWKSFIAKAGLSDRTIKEYIEDGTIPEEMIEYGRKRVKGREIVSISRDALKKLKK